MIATAMDELGKVDVLINNAGMTQENVRKPIWEISDDDWRVGIDTNLSSAFYCSRARFEAHGGQGQRENHQCSVGIRVEGRARHLDVLLREGRDGAVDASVVVQPCPVRRDGEHYNSRLHTYGGDRRHA